MQSEVVASFTDQTNNDRIIKLHLFDDSLNVHGWGIDREFAASLAKQYEGTPYLIPPNLNHPVRPYQPYLHDPQADIQDIQRYAQQYIAGQCFKTELCAQAPSKFGYDGYIKLTDPKAIEAFDRGLIPRFASISLYNLDSVDSGYIRKGQALNICAVAKPAYSGAQILGTCKGDENSCHSNLKNASAASESKKKDYCILDILEKAEQDIEKFNSNVNASLNSQTEKTASYQSMSTNIGSNPQEGASPSSGTTVPAPQAQPAAAPVEVKISPPTSQQQQQQTQQQQVTPENDNKQFTPQQLEQIHKDIDVVAETQKAYDQLKIQAGQKDAVVSELQRKLLEYQQREEELKIREIERFVSLELFNGDSKERNKKVEEWKQRAANMGIHDLSWHLTESYGRIPKQDKEKKAGVLQYEPTAVLTSDSQSNKQQQGQQKKFSIYDITSLDFSQAGGGL